MRQLEMIVGAGRLRGGLREYLGSHAYGNASWPDLIRVLDAKTPHDLAGWSRAWVEEEGRPTIATSDVDSPGAGVGVVFTQRDARTERGLTWPQRLRVSFGYADRVVTLDVALEQPRISVFAPHAARPLFVLPAGEGIAYGDVVLDEASRSYLLAHLADVRDALTRGAALVTLWEEMLGARIPAATMLDTIVTTVQREPDELNVQRMLSYLQEAFWKFIPAAEREQRAAGLEEMLRQGLAAAKTSSLKSAWFNALRDLALTSPTLAWLERVWRKTEVVPGLTLAEPDYITLAMELAVRAVPGWHAILDQQLARIENPDRKARFEFVRPALSADSAERDAFFAGLHDPKNRRREAWVLEAAGYLHHPLRAASSEKHIPAALALLREIQRTGDIFFPKRWMDATLSGHRSESAARMVRSFLTQLPSGYPERLRRIVLSAADDLFRASR
jgi:aminopeptidase N